MSKRTWTQDACEPRYFRGKLSAVGGPRAGNSVWRIVVGNQAELHTADLARREPKVLMPPQVLSQNCCLHSEPPIFIMMFHSRREQWNDPEKRRITERVDAREHAVHAYTILKTI